MMASTAAFPETPKESEWWMMCCIKSTTYNRATQIVVLIIVMLIIVMVTHSYDHGPVCTSVNGDNPIVEILKHQSLWFKKIS